MTTWEVVIPTATFCFDGEAGRRRVGSTAAFSAAVLVFRAAMCGDPPAKRWSAPTRRVAQARARGRVQTVRARHAIAPAVSTAAARCCQAPLRVSW